MEHISAVLPQPSFLMVQRVHKMKSMHEIEVGTSSIWKSQQEKSDIFVLKRFIRNKAGEWSNTRADQLPRSQVNGSFIFRACPPRPPPQKKKQGF